MAFDGKQVKNLSNPTGTGKYLDERGKYVTLPIGGSSFSMTLIEINLGNIAQDSGSFKITGLSDLIIDSPVMIIQAPGPYTGKGDLADESEEMILANGYVIDATTIQVYWSGINQSCLIGNVKFLYKIL
jgi:hypothetical protein